MQNLSFAISGSLCDERDNLSAAWAAKSEGLLRGLQENPLNMSRDEYDERVRRNYAERQQAEADARYEDFDIEEAEERLRDEWYWIDRLFERRRQGYSFDGDEKVAAERDVLSNILAAASLIPGIDTFADAAAIPIDLLRGDYISAGLDAIGVIPFVGETADTAKLVRAGINVSDAASDAGKVIEAVKAADKADDVADVLKTENNVGELAKPYPKENLPKEVVEWIRKLPQYKDAIEISSTPSYEQISLLSRQEGVEFASITIGNRNIILRGDTCGTPISKELLEDMIRNKGVSNCHSHPYVGDLQPSKSDLRLAQILSHQEEFEIITPDNMRAVYTKHGIKSVGNIERKLSEHDVLELYKLFGG